MHTSPIEKEVAFYERKRPELVAKSDGKFVLIKGERVEGTFDDFDEAIGAGYDRFGLEPFLVRRVSAIDETINLTSMLVSP